MNHVPIKLTHFVFILMRDYLTAGDIAAIMREHVDKCIEGGSVEYQCPSTPWLPGVARDLAERLVA